MDDWLSKERTAENNKTFEKEGRQFAVVNGQRRGSFFYSDSKLEGAIAGKVAAGAGRREWEQNGRSG